ncbi:hypothetical protein SLEP1_g12147 [Rubroshorea leprosula]|nr:hypothetical protein SLEP1_g12147 [Rubroshorea leprosula]
MTTRSVDTPKSVTAKKSPPPPPPPPSKSATKAATKSMATSNEFETPRDKAAFFCQSKEAEEWRSINY